VIDLVYLPIIVGISAVVFLGLVRYALFLAMRGGIGGNGF